MYDGHNREPKAHFDFKDYYDRYQRNFYLYYQGSRPYLRHYNGQFYNWGMEAYYLAVDYGRHLVHSNYAYYEAGRVSHGAPGWHYVRFSKCFAQTPTVFTQVQTWN